MLEGQCRRLPHLPQPCAALGAHGAIQCDTQSPCGCAPSLSRRVLSALISLRQSLARAELSLCSTRASRLLSSTFEQEGEVHFGGCPGASLAMVVVHSQGNPWPREDSCAVQVLPATNPNPTDYAPRCCLLPSLTNYAPGAAGGRGGPPAPAASCRLPPPAAPLGCPQPRWRLRRPGRGCGGAGEAGRQGRGEVGLPGRSTRLFTDMSGQHIRQAVRLQQLCMHVPALTCHAPPLGR